MQAAPGAGVTAADASDRRYLCNPAAPPLQDFAVDCLGRIWPPLQLRVMRGRPCGYQFQANE